VILNRESASWDWSKIIRADYTDILYCRLALEARQSWRTEPLYREFYHETGLIWVDQTGFSEKVVTNYANLGVEEKLRMVPVETLRKIEGGLFESADFGTNDMVYVNDCSGWVEAYKALERITESAATAGVQLVESNISRLTFDANGNCTGAQSTDGESFLAQNIILATGAETARLLVESAPSHLKLHAGNRLRAAGLITGVVRLDSEEAIRHRAAPAFLHAEGQAKGILGFIFYCNSLIEYRSNYSA
jgi:sarcosine oxidase/L-pipecolate oxidase